LCGLLSDELLAMSLPIKIMKFELSSCIIKLMVETITRAKDRLKNRDSLRRDLNENKMIMPDEEKWYERL
jgi:hypothetical protein